MSYEFKQLDLAPIHKENQNIIFKWMYFKGYLWIA